VRVVREDPRNPALLYAGTERGLFVSGDRGAHWVRIESVPPVIVDDLVVHPRDHDLVVGTHGRSLYVVDDVGPLQELTPEVAAKPLHLFAPRPAFGRYTMEGWADWNGVTDFRGENPPDGALISFWIAEWNGKPLEIAIENDKGQPVAKLQHPGAPGIGRVSWNLRPSKEFLTEYGGLGAEKLVPAGDFTVTLSRGAERAQATLMVTIAEGIETR
jgi:hypothetical protein